MRRILFVDFDGVLHGMHDAELALLPRLEAVLRRMPEAEVVISSSWRETFSLSELRALFSASLRHRVVGVTPVLADGYCAGGRQREIVAFLTRNAVGPDRAVWRALDDVAHLFEDGCPYLIRVDSDLGFTQADGERLIAWYESTGQDACTGRRS